MDKHTPGPWQYWDSNNDPEAEPWYVIDALSQEPTQRGAMIDIMEGRTSEANARLIAAAPALFDALAAIMANPYITEEMPEAVWLAADAALYDAKGGSLSENLRENSAIEPEARP